jgi:hypothetical protein
VVTLWGDVLSEGDVSHFGELLYAVGQSRRRSWSNLERGAGPFEFCLALIVPKLACVLGVVLAHQFVKRIDYDELVSG